MKFKKMSKGQVVQFLIFAPLYLLAKLVELIVEVFLVITAMLCNFGFKVLILAVILSFISSGLDGFKEYWYIWLGAGLFIELFPKLIGYLDYLAYCAVVELEEKAGL